MAFCTHCGAALPADARFCPDCGKPAGAPADVASAPPPAAPSPATAPIADPRPGPAPGADPRPFPGPPPMGMPRDAQQRRRGAGGGGGLILPIMIVAALLVIGIMLWTQRDGTRPIAGTDAEQAEGKSAEVTVRNTGDDAATAVAEADTADTDSPDEATRTTVASLDAAFRNDPQGARARYAGPLTLSGTVAAPTPVAAPSISLEGRMPFNYVVANLRDPSAFAGAARGSRVTLACNGVTAIAGTTILQGCALD